MPLRAIRVLRERYGSPLPLDELCEAYCAEYLAAAGQTDEDRKTGKGDANG